MYLSTKLIGYNTIRKDGVYFIEITIERKEKKTIIKTSKYGIFWKY